MKGIAYGVGIGPGDPELITLKAVRLIKENEIIAVPGKVAEESKAYQIAVQVVPELAEKTVIPINMPMVLDREALREKHEESADIIAKYLEQGKNVVYLTLGDPTIYCTYTYLQNILEERGYETRLVSGVTSFCAAAARLNIPIAEWNEEIHVIPAAHKLNKELNQPGTYVLMKSASHMQETKEILRAGGKNVCAVENCGMEGEQVHRNLDEIPDDAGYFSLIIAKDKK